MNQALLDLDNLQSSVATLQNQVDQLTQLATQLTCKSQSQAFTTIDSKMKSYWDQYAGTPGINGVIADVQQLAARLADPDREPFTPQDTKTLQGFSDWATRVAGTDGRLDTNVYEMMRTFHDLLLKGPGGTQLSDGPLYDCANARLSDWAKNTDSVIDDRAYYQVRRGRQANPSGPIYPSSSPQGSFYASFIVATPVAWLVPPTCWNQSARRPMTPLYLSSPSVT